VDVIDLGVPRERDPSLPPHLHFHRSPVLRWLKKAQEKAGAAILDPPRAGLAQELDDIEKELRRLGVREIFAVGCDVDSWARDITSLMKKGWRLQRVAFLDFFPQTPHFESVAHLFV
jgi:23S rRNA (uracil1939-C5)-methyltransferase